jgi:hypothetical protein
MICLSMSKAWPELVGDSACGEGGEFSAPLRPFAPFLSNMRTKGHVLISSFTFDGRTKEGIHVAYRTHADAGVMGSESQDN